MAPVKTKIGGSTRLLDTIEHAEHTSLEAVRKFIDSVDSVIPHRGRDDGPRRKIIDSAFAMTEQLVGTSTGLAQHVLDVTGQALTESGRKSAPKVPAKKAPGPRTTAKRAPARKVAARNGAAKKSPAKRVPARKMTARRASARKAPMRQVATRQR